MFPPEPSIGSLTSIIIDKNADSFKTINRKINVISFSGIDK